MIRNRPVTAIIPVRAGSKGIPGKNALEVGGMSLLERTILLAKSSKYVDRVIVSTESPDYMKTAERHEVASKELRPAELATETASTIDVILHESKVNEVGAEDYILLLQVTTPFRTSEDLKNFLENFEKSENGISSVSLTPHSAPHPDKIQKIENGFVESYLGKESMVARQLLPKVYSLNGAFYLAPLAQIEKDRTFFSKETLPFIIPEERSLNLDTLYDYYLMEALIERGVVNLDDHSH